MAGNLSPRAQIKVAALRTMADKVQHVYGLVEKFAAERNPKVAEQMAQPMKRAFGRLKIDLMGAGFDTLSQQAGSMEIAAGRGGSQRNKARILREGVGSLRFQVEQEQKKIVAEDRRRQAAEAAEEEEASGGSGPDPD